LWFNLERFIMKTPVLAALLAGFALAPVTSAFAQAAAAAESPWLVRVRAVNLDSANKDTTGLGLSVNDKVIPEVDISYFFNKNLAAELILTVPQRHDVRSNGAKIGTLKHLPPTFLVQYHFDLGGVKPYVGVGLNYTRFSSVNILNGGATIDKDSFGGALQAGVDIPLTGKFSLNLDLKKVYIGTDVAAGGRPAGKFKVDPVLFGVGLGYRF
jgi:outer membrane protein